MFSNVKRHLHKATSQQRSDAVSRVLEEIDLPDLRMLDIGCAYGEKTVRWANQLGIPSSQVYGIEIQRSCLLEARERLRVICLDIENNDLAFKDESFDLVICSEVFEHIKNIHNLIDEICRITKLGGYFLVTVPNLSAFHNRLLLILGYQPTSMNVFGNHIRGFTYREFVRFTTASGAFALVVRSGHGLYPFPPGLAKWITRLYPSVSVNILLLLKKVSNVYGFYSKIIEGKRDTTYRTTKAKELRH